LSDRTGGSSPPADDQRSRLPPLSPLSRRIQTQAERMGVVRILGLAGRPMTFEVLDFTHEAPVQLREEQLLAPRGTGELRPMERPNELEGMLSTCTPQFFLRNTGRIAREELRLEFERAEAVSRPDDPGALIRAAMGPPEPLPPTVVDEVRAYLAERSELMVSAWNSRFGRPDPQ